MFLVVLGPNNQGVNEFKTLQLCLINIFSRYFLFFKITSQFLNTLSGIFTVIFNSIN